MAETDITRLLRDWAGGDHGALEKLMPVVYAEMHRIARVHMRREQRGRTLQASALVNEAYLRLARAAGASYQDRQHFFAVSAQIMRRILVDAARERGAARRGGGGQRVTLDKLTLAASERDAELVALDEALAALGRVDPRKAKVVEMRFFGGMSVEETAQLLGLSPQSILRDWKLARAWLTRELNRADAPVSG